MKNGSYIIFHTNYAPKTVQNRINFCIVNNKQMRTVYIITMSRINVIEVKTFEAEKQSNRQKIKLY